MDTRPTFSIIEILFNLRNVMNAIKFNYIFFLLIIVLLLQGCTKVVRYKNPDAPDFSVGILTTDKPERIRIFTVDGVKATGKYKDESVREFPSTVRLLPGYHEVVPCYVNVKGIRYGEKLKFYVQEENTYIINHKFKWDKSIRFWVECNSVDVTTE
jgi:hypothetical protein